MRRFSLIGIVLCAAVVLTGASSLETEKSPLRDPNGVIVHEWGTFTSVAAPDGSAVEWVPQQGPSDLPCFVNRARLAPKSWLRALVRMETPVLYFYASHDATLDVRVRFRRGVMTEWFPRAAVSPMDIDDRTLRKPDFMGEIAWKGVKVLPRAAQDFPADSTDNHYYAARATDAAPVQVGAEREKFLFYRGVASFEPPLRAMVRSDGRISVKAEPNETIGDILLFENRGGAMAYAHIRSDAAQVVLPVPGSNHRLESITTDLENLLVARGLYRREARAMIDTWKGAWFEEGTRLFYIVSPRTIDAVLPLEIAPAPAAVARVFVGRLEILTASTIDDVKAALAKRDHAGILRHRRFLDPIMARLHPTFDGASRDDWQFVYSAVQPRLRACR